MTLSRSILLFSAPLIMLLLGCQPHPQTWEAANSPPQALESGNATALDMVAPPPLTREEITDLRIAELEFKVLSLENDVDRLSRGLGQLQSKAPVKKVPAATSKKDPAPLKKPSGKAEIENIRTGVYPGKTRLVIDLGRSADFKLDIDNDEKLAIIELPSITATALTEKALGTPLLSAAKVQTSETGSRVIISLKQPVKAQSSSKLNPAAQYGYRVVVDFIAQ